MEVLKYVVIVEELVVKFFFRTEGRHGIELEEEFVKENVFA